ncbi:MAG: class I SAM-dependent methyltransferase [Vicinamibacteria bacterium]
MSQGPGRLAGRELQQCVCPACRGPARQRGLKLGHVGFECIKCGSFRFERQTGLPQEDAVSYTERYRDSCFQVEPAAAGALSALVRSMAPYRQTGRWLDVGFGEGGLLLTAAASGWSCYGVELATAALEFGGRQGWVVANDASSDPRFPESTFDVVSMIELLEHVFDPDALLALAVAKLRPGGCLYVTTPNAESLNFRLLGLDWSVMAPPEHCTVWTRRGLRAAIRRANLSPQRLATEGLNPVEIVDHLKHLGRPGRSAIPAAGRNQAAFALNSTFAKSPMRRLVKRGANLLLSWMGLGDTLKLWAQRG